MQVARRVERVQAHHLLLGVLTLFYFVGAFTITFAPDVQLFTEGTRPVFDLLPPGMWAAWFLAASFACGALATHLTGRRQIVTWAVVIPSQTIWISAGLIAVWWQGRGSALAVVFTVTVFLFTLVTVWVAWRAYSTGKR